MIAGKKYIGIQVDIWSSGVILFALLCGHLPFEDPNTSNLYNKIMAGEYKIPKHVSSEAKDLIKNILNTDPTKRFTIEEIRKHSWYNIHPKVERKGIIVGVDQIPVFLIRSIIVFWQSLINTESMLNLLKNALKQINIVMLQQHIIWNCRSL